MKKENNSGTRKTSFVIAMVVILLTVIFPSANQQLFEKEVVQLPGFRNEKLLKEHYEKHGMEMGFDSPEEYEAAAIKAVQNENALHKTEAEDGDDVYYVEETNEFVIVSGDGYIRTYYYPQDGIAYYNRQ